MNTPCQLQRIHGLRGLPSSVMRVINALGVYPRRVCWLSEITVGVWAQKKSGSSTLPGKSRPGDSEPLHFFFILTKARTQAKFSPALGAQSRKFFDTAGNNTLHFPCRPRFARATCPLFPSEALAVLCKSGAIFLFDKVGLCEYGVSIRRSGYAQKGIGPGCIDPLRLFFL